MVKAALPDGCRQAAPIGDLRYRDFRRDEPGIDPCCARAVQEPLCSRRILDVHEVPNGRSQYEPILRCEADGDADRPIGARRLAQDGVEPREVDPCVGIARVQMHVSTQCTDSAVNGCRIEASGTKSR